MPSQGIVTCSVSKNELNDDALALQPIFTMSAQQQNLKGISASKYDDLKNYYSKDPAAAAFLANYQSNDVYIASIYGVSTATWDISPPSKIALNDSLLEDRVINLYVTISFTR